MISRAEAAAQNPPEDLEDPEEEEEEPIPEGNLVDPQTGETVEMPKADEVSTEEPDVPDGVGDGLLTGVIDTSLDDNAP